MNNSLILISAALVLGTAFAANAQSVGNQPAKFYLSATSAVNRADVAKEARTAIATGAFKDNFLETIAP